MNASQRLVLNTVATYARSVMGIALALFSSRWVLNALGQSDFGLFSLIGAIVVFIIYLNGVMAGSASRHFAYSMGQGNADEVNKWFNAALCIHLCIGTVLVILGWPLGEYLIRHVFAIPIDRISSCIWVFRISLISAFVSMISVPFLAMFTAQQHIFELAIWGILQIILTFALAGCLFYVPGDRLLFYAIGMVSIFVLVQSVQVLRAMIVFKECSIVLAHWFDRHRFIEILSFAGWNLFGSTGTLLRDQGSAILLNLYFGPVINASYGIATQVSSATNQLSAAMMGAFSPEIMASEGRGNRARMLSLSQCASKYGTIFVLLFAIPLMLEMDYVLKIWLKDTPVYTAKFCRLILSMYLIDRLTTGYMMAVSAHGKIAAYQATLGTSLIMTLPLAWLFLKLGCAPTSVGVAFIITMLFCSLGRVFWAQRLFGSIIRNWLFGIVGPCIAVASTSTLIGVLAKLFLAESLTRFILVVGMCIVVTVVTGWFWAFNDTEKEFFKYNLAKFLGKVWALFNNRINPTSI